MHIAIVIDSLRTGGAEILTIRLAKLFVRKGHRLSIIALGEIGQLVPMLRKADLFYLALNCPVGISPSAILKLFKILKKEQCDLIITNHFRQLAHVFVPATALAIPHYHIEHDNYLYKTQKKYLTFLRFFLLRLQKLIVIAPTLERWFADQLPSRENKIILIPNGVETTVFLPSPRGKLSFRQRHGLLQDCKVFGTCARLEPIKNIGLMLRIFHAYHADNPNSCLLLLGDGSYRPKLEQEAKDMGLFNSIFFTGMQHDVVPWLQAMDVYLLTSDDEGLPLSVLEAMACEVPIVARAVGDLPRLITPCVGRLVDTTAISEWLRAIHEVVDDIEIHTHLAENARQIVIQSYSLTRCVSAYLSLFESASL
jgi:glycosyltransferase involved in cell wall biosynthesis